MKIICVALALLAMLGCRSSKPTSQAPVYYPLPVGVNWTPLPPEGARSQPKVVEAAKPPQLTANEVAACDRLATVVDFDAYMKERESTKRAAAQQPHDPERVEELKEGMIAYVGWLDSYKGKVELSEVESVSLSPDSMHDIAIRRVKDGILVDCDQAGTMKIWESKTRGGDGVPVIGTFRLKNAPEAK